jgi:predicted GNAT family acetyltransferase
MPETPSVSHNQAAGLFEIRTEQGTAVLRYALAGPDLDVVHTEVPDALEGQGYGSALAEAVLSYAKEGGVKIIPSCPFMSEYLRRHPEHTSLVATR